MPDKEELMAEGELVYYAHQLSKKFRKLLIVPIGDIHYGNPLFSKKHLDMAIHFIDGNPNAYTFLTGDLCESAIRTSKGEIFRQVGSPQDQRDWIIERFKPIKDKVLGVIMGNHEMRIYNDVGIDICKDIAQALGVPYRIAGMGVKISFGSGNEGHPDRAYTYWGYFTHGYGGARTKASKAVKVERTAYWIHANFYVMSHDHVVNIAPDVYLLPDPRTRREKDKDGKETGFTVGRVTAHRKMLVKTNAYLKWGGYAEMLGFPPSDLSYPIIKLYGQGKPKVKVEV